MRRNAEMLVVEIDQLSIFIKIVLLYNVKLILTKHPLYFPMTTQKYTNLYSILDKFLLSNTNIYRQTFQTIIFKEPLLLTVMQCSNLKFASDLHHTIQLIVYDKNNRSPQDVSLQISPFNKIANNYYKKLDEKKFNFWQAYNCNNQSLLSSEDIEQSSPYTPQFYFGKGFRQFKSMKSLDNDVTLPPSLNNKVISITQWKIKIVNISQTGWYAPVIEALVWQSQKLINRQNYKHVNLILYQPKVKQTMQLMWQKDLKQTKFRETQLNTCFSFTMKIQAKTSLSRANHFTWDQKQQKIKFNKDKRHYRVPLGKYEQQNFNFLQQLHKVNQIDKKVTKQKLIRKQLKVKFNNSKIKEAERKASETQVSPRKNGQLWSSDEENSEQEQQNLQQVQILSDQYQQQQASQQQPVYLRNTYLKYIKSQKNMIN